MSKHQPEGKIAKHSLINILMNKNKIYMDCHHIISKNVTFRHISINDLENNLKILSIPNTTGTLQFIHAIDILVE